MEFPFSCSRQNAVCLQQFVQQLLSYLLNLVGFSSFVIAKRIQFARAFNVAQKRTSTALAANVLLACLLSCPPWLIIKEEFGKVKTKTKAQNANANTNSNKNIRRPTANMSLFLNSDTALTLCLVESFDIALLKSLPLSIALRDSYLLTRGSPFLGAQFVFVYSFVTWSSCYRCCCCCRYRCFAFNIHFYLRSAIVLRLLRTVGQMQ